MRGNRYQISLIVLGFIVTGLFSIFLFREWFPEYRIYQGTYIKLEEFRSTYTSEPPPPFETGVKQILLARTDRGPPLIDRCVSCHVALQFSHFSPTKVVKDSQGAIVYDEKGTPVQEANEEYIWKKLDEKIADFRLNKKIKEAEELNTWKTAKIGEHIYDITKVLKAHPLIGKETRPFEFHNIDDYGCVSCHSGNGLGLVTDRAHGPIFDGEYEEEFLGPEPEFLESDPLNDPAFSKIFNHKPGHRLLFQTNPLYLGALIQAKCANCHLTKDTTPAQMNLENKTEPKTENILQNYFLGRELYISQACYGCHRINGFARGGVGPELTNAGNTYPWFLKQSIVWPQADLKTSTMPNFHLDHGEIENLMTFLLAQHGKNQAISEIDYKQNVLKWEAGAKLPWEEPVNPGKLHDTHHAMTIFASEGCAACHRLKGFESDVGYTIEKQKQEIDFKTLYQERLWFTKLFPEDIPGSELVKTIELHKEEIDKKITSDVRKGSLLEELKNTHPELIESFYPNFHFANRAKNSLGDDLALKNWKDRVNRVLMMFIQEYGLGRLIGPKPNWSGIYRSDEWLIEHFRQPGRYTAKSIMPVMPFDISKFYTLTYMLDVLAKKNRDDVREIWTHYGFEPERAYQIYCSQCHGEFLHGNGPVAEWIYPIPKNLRNSDFLRNYTKKNIVDSITHGVKGTPMPPWGEIAQNKSTANDTPVLSANEITQLVDWIFSSLFGGNERHQSENLPKWDYSPEDVIEELIREGNKLKPGSNPKFLELKESKPMEDLKAQLDEKQYLASLNQKVYTQPKQSVDQIFDTYINPESDSKNYYIKKKYYTEDNIRAGQHFFELNCAVCHGNEADGQGYRAGSMYEAKPRMLTNLHWAETRDDLRLLQSIKYGVSGTAMTPWGDLTSSLQRLQLVIFIRSLSLDQELRDNLFNELYRVFDEEEQVLDTGRIKEYQVINQIKNEIHETKKKREEHLKKTPEDSKEIVDLYQKELNLSQKLQQHEKADSLIVELKNLVRKEGKIYQELGITLVNQIFTSHVFEEYLKTIQLAKKTITISEDGLKIDFNKNNQIEAKKINTRLLHNFKEQIKKANAAIKSVQGQLPNEKQRKEIEKLKSELNAFEKAYKSLKELTQRSSDLRKQQEEVYIKLKGIDDNL